MSIFIRLFVLSQYILSHLSFSSVAITNQCFAVTALVPARSGSKGIKEKNLSLMGNETLLARTLKAIHKCKKFESIWVSTDGEAISNEALSHGANVHWRNPITATDDASTLSAVEDFLLTHKDKIFVAVIQCTSPFIKKKFLCDAIDNLFESNADCIFSVTKSHHLRWKKNKDNFVSPINFNPKKRPRRQDWEGELLENGMFYITKRNLVLKHQMLQNERCLPFEIPKLYSLEIDNKLDLDLAKLIATVVDNLKPS